MQMMSTFAGCADLKAQTTQICKDGHWSIFPKSNLQVIHHQISIKSNKFDYKSLQANMQKGKITNTHFTKLASTNQ